MATEHIYPREAWPLSGVAERLTLDQALYHTPQLLAVATDAYTNQIEHVLRAAPEGTLASAGYRPHDHQAIQSYRGRIAKHMKQGSAYHVIRHPAYPQLFQAVLKTSPGTAIPYVSDEALYINDIVVGVRYQHQGLGSKLLRAVLGEFSIRPDTPIVLEGFRRSPLVNGWFERIGLINTGASPEPSAFGPYIFDMDIYQTPPGVAPQAVRTALSAHR